MKHLNELHQKYKLKGLIVTATTKEGASVATPWLEAQGAEYPVFQDDGGATARAYGVRGIPHAVVIGPDGKVAYKGSPGGITDQVLEPILAKCVLRFEYAFPAAFSGVHTKIAKKDFAGAYKVLDKVKTEGDEAATAFASKVRADLDGYIADMREQAANDAKAGDYLAAEATLKTLAKQYKGTPAGKEVDDQLKAWNKDSKIKNEIKAGKVMVKAKLMEKAMNFKAALGLYLSVAKKYKGTKTAEKAQASADKIQEGALWKIDPKCKKCTGARSPCDKHA